MHVVICHATQRHIRSLSINVLSFMLILQMALEISNKLDNLATVMRLYSRGTFGKDAHQWTKCVVKYLTDIYETEHLHVITLLLEVCTHFALLCYADSIPTIQPV